LNDIPSGSSKKSKSGEFFVNFSKKSDCLINNFQTENLLPFFFVLFLFGQTQEWLHVVIFAEEGAIPPRRLLLEEAQGRQDDARRSHETQSARNRGETHISYFSFSSSRVPSSRGDGIRKNR
jgi:hypothetical protein